MADEPITTPEPQGVDPGLAAIIEDVLDSRDAAQREEVKSTLAQLAQPQPGSRVAAILPTTRERVGDGGVRVIPHSARLRRYRDLYRKSSKAVQECRTEELDHWNHQWMLAVIDKNPAKLRQAYDAANSAYARQFGASPWSHAERTDAEDESGWKGESRFGGRVGADGAFERADILEGATDVSDPTAILDGTGGSLLPQPFTQVVAIARERTAVIESLATVFQMTSATLRIPTSGAATAAKVAEGGTPGDGESTYASLMLKAEKNAVFMEASREFIADSAFNALQQFGERAGMALGANQDVDFLTSDGAAPNCTAALIGADVTETTSTAVGYVDLSILYRSVSQRDRRDGCAWLGGNVLTFLDNLLDGNGRPILSDPGATPQSIGDSPGNEGFIKRWPIYEVPAVDGDLIFGNIRQGYAVGRREGITARASTDSAFKTGLVQFLIEERYDGLLVEAAAIHELRGIISAT